MTEVQLDEQWQEAIDRHRDMICDAIRTLRSEVDDLRATLDAIEPRLAFASRSSLDDFLTMTTWYAVNLAYLEDPEMTEREARASLTTAGATFGWPTFCGRVLEQDVNAATPRRSGPRRASISVSKRLKVYASNDHRCAECGSAEDLTIDHIVPLSAGGSDELDNLQTLCRRCNCSKGART